jgi:hypothetical protein
MHDKFNKKQDMVFQSSRCSLHSSSNEQALALAELANIVFPVFRFYLGCSIWEMLSHCGVMSDSMVMKRWVLLSVFHAGFSLPDSV